MTPKEKAKELVDKFMNCDNMIFLTEGAKECALIAVDEVKWFHQRLFYLTEGSIFDKYLEDVKKEIEKL
jgi:hypothetical protein